MKQLKEILDSLSLRQKILIVAGLLAVGAALSGVVNWRHENGFKTLYSRLSQEDAAAIVQKLKEASIEYRLDESGGTVLIAADRLAETRLLLAGSGLPKSGRIGFELFDRTNFGASDFTEHINYRRALEGELERSILSLSDVESARVHITFPKESVFTEARQPAKASVMVSMRNNAKLSPANVAAVTQMVASAVEGLSAQAVSVVDRRGQLLTRKQKGPGDEAEYNESLLEYKHQVEQDLLTKINRTLQPVLGAEKFQAGVSVECDFTTSEQSEEVVDPSRSVMVNSQKQEETITNGSTPAGIPGTSSNLPRPPAKATPGPSDVKRRTENISYQSSRSVRHIKTPRGVVKQVSVAVLVDQDVRWEGQGPQAKRVLVPPSAETLKVIQEMVSRVGGVSPERGDRITVDSLPFEATLRMEPPSEQKPPTTPTTSQPPNLLELLKGGGPVVIGVAAGGLILVCALLFLAFRKPRVPAVTVNAELPPVPNVPAIAGPAGTESIDRDDVVQQHLSAGTEPERDPFEALRPSANSGSRAELLVQYLGEEIGKDAQTSAQILRTWLVQTEES